MSKLNEFEEILKLVKEFKNVGCKLRDKMMDTNIENILAEGYPFEEGFGEVTFNLVEWIENLEEKKEELKEEKTEKKKEEKILKKIIAFQEELIGKYHGDQIQARQNEEQFIEIKYPNDKGFSNTLWDITADESMTTAVNPDEYYYQGITRDFINKFAMKNPEVFARFVNEVEKNL